MKFQKPALSNAVVVYDIDEEKLTLCLEVGDNILRHYIYDSDVWSLKQQTGEYGIAGVVSRLIDFWGCVEWLKTLTLDDVPAEFMAHHNQSADREERMNKFRGSILGKVFGIDDDMGDGDDESTE